MSLGNPSTLPAVSMPALPRGKLTTVSPSLHDALVRDIAPAIPTYLLDLEKVQERTRMFLNEFRGTSMYAVKANPSAEIIRAMAATGMTDFDVASLKEMALVKANAPHAKMYFMHPVKAEEAIETAYFDYGVKSFVLDFKDELFKITRMTGLAQDLELFVRIALPKNKEAGIDLSSKFGASVAEAIELLQMARPYAKKLGLAFHVGTQNASRTAYIRAIELAAKTVEASGVTIDALDIGGGFPVTYTEKLPVTIEDLFATIHATHARTSLKDVPLLCEPGRALVAESMSLIVRVEQRRGNRLYINDGTYGGLFDAGPILNEAFPVHAIMNGTHKKSQPVEAFTFAGPTCDSLDMMEGPFLLPASISAGDWIEIRNVGAYSSAMRSDFNGFGEAQTILI